VLEPSEGGRPAAGPSLTFDVVVSYAGTIWTGLVQLLLVPLYVRRLGVEAYGVVGLFVTLQAVAQVLDLGLSPTINRELARGAAFGAPAAEQRDLARTLEWIYWGTGALLGLAIAGAAPLLATRWVNVGAMPTAEVALAFAFMGLALAFEWPSACYRGALLGLQRQAAVNGLAVAAATVHGAGAVVVVLLAPSPVVSLFAWRAAVALLQTLVGRWMAWRALRGSGTAAPARFRLERLASTWRFSAGMAGISITSVALLQADKVVLSRLLPLEAFGAYMVASTVAGLLPQLVSPVFAAVFPRLSRLVAAGDAAGQAREFHLAAQVVTVVVHPAALCLALFPAPAIQAWTGDAALAARAGPALALLATGAILNSAMVLPYALQLAHGWTRLAVALNAALIAFVVPYTYLAASRFGITGAASAWAVLNGLYLAAGAPITLRRLLPGQGLSWLWRDLAGPLAAAGAAAALVALAVPRPSTVLATLATLAGAGVLALAAALATAGALRRSLATALASARAAVTTRGAPP
jgi:O-antigen/teichoic acid export membrane protein